MTAKTTFLGLKLSKNGVQSDSKRVNKLKEPIPKTKNDIKKVLGVLQWFRPFVKNLSVETKFLTEMLKKTNRVHWNIEKQKKHNYLISEIKHELLLIYPDYSKIFIIETDASKFDGGAIVKQTNRPIALYSTTWNKSELNYSICEKEMLIILKTLDFFINLLLGTEIILFTDNKNILFNKPITHRVERWKLIIAEFNIKFRHIFGLRNYIADSLSRINNLI